VIGGAGNDTMTGSAFSDLLFGGPGFDFVNGGFGFDRVNGGTGGDRFFHTGDAGHGSDWIQDYDAGEGDVLLYGGQANANQFRVITTETRNAGQDGVEEAFVVHTPTGQILWALVDGAAQNEINLSLGGQVVDLFG
jgi:Ca2+-binding RTX toxin-like protein